MKKIKPTVTVLMPVYNGEKYLKEAIESILNQNYKNFEFIIIDDGSIDGSKKIIKSYKDKRIHYYSNKQNIGLSKTLNRGICLAGGKYIARMDADDVSLLNRLEKQVGYMDKNTGVAVCGSWAKAIDEKGEFLYNMRTPVGFWLDCNFWKPSPIIHPSAIIRKSFLAGLDFHGILVEDYDLWLRLKKKGKLANLSRYLLKYRIHRESVSQNSRSLQLKLSYESFVKEMKIEKISYSDFLSLASLEYKLGLIKRTGLLLRLSKKIDYPWWFVLVDSFVYLLRKWF